MGLSHFLSSCLPDRTSDFRTAIAFSSPESWGSVRIQVMTPQWVSERLSASWGQPGPGLALV